MMPTKRAVVKPERLLIESSLSWNGRFGGRAKKDIVVEEEAQSRTGEPSLQQYLKIFRVQNPHVQELEAELANCKANSGGIMLSEGRVIIQQTKPITERVLDGIIIYLPKYFLEISACAGVVFLGLQCRPDVTEWVALPEGILRSDLRNLTSRAGTDAADSGCKAQL